MNFVHFGSERRNPFILGFIVLKLDVQTVLDPHFHLDGGVELGVAAECVHHDVQLFADVVQSPADCRPQKVAGGQKRSHGSETRIQGCVKGSTVRVGPLVAISGNHFLGMAEKHSPQNTFI